MTFSISRLTPLKTVILVLAIGCWLIVQPSNILAQPADTVLADFEKLAAFDEAVSMAIDPAGQVYVVDRGRHHIVLLSPDGARKRVLGGPGRSEGQFDEPSDIDPTNGLVLVVSDAGNGRVQRFSSEFLFLESLPVHAGGTVSRENNFASQPLYRQRTDDASISSPGRPEAIRTASDNTMFALETVGGVVMKWDVDRNLEYEIGGYDQGNGSLLEPVAMVVDRNALYVGDRAHASVFVYDVFGGFERTMAEGLCENVRALELAGDWLVVGLTDRLLWYHKRGRLERVFDLSLPEEVVDIAYSGSFLYVLGEKTLYRTMLEF